MKQIEWLMLNFTLPKEPSRVRVSVWRKLKKCGSVNIGQSMWLLPITDECKNIFTEISDVILQNNGEAYIMKSNFLSMGNTANIQDIFNTARDDEYKEFLDKCDDLIREIEKETAKEKFDFAEIDENEREYDKLTVWYKEIGERDFWGAPLKEPSGEALSKCRIILDEYCGKVYEKNNIE